MSAQGEALAVAALRLEGVRFRLRGRDPETGVDCIGLLACALRECGRLAVFPAGYQLRVRDWSGAGEWARRNGFVVAGGDILAGDVAMFVVGPEQVHLAIALSAGEFVHAHAGLRRVVRSPVGEDWSFEGHWRLAGLVPAIEN